MLCYKPEVIMQPHTESLIREYKKTKQYQRDAAQLARDGWLPSSTTTAGGGPRWYLGFLGLVFRKKARIVVTYTRNLPA
jgi:hypothetical protein